MKAMIYPFPWAEEAACSPHNRDNDVSHLFFHPSDRKEGYFERQIREQDAAAICDGCPVRRQCRRDAMRTGIWGGTKPKRNWTTAADPERVAIAKGPR